MDLGLRAKVVWVLAPASEVAWKVAETFLAESSVVRVVTSRTGGCAASAALQLRFGQNLSVERVGGEVRLLSRALQQRLGGAGQPDVIVLVQTAVIGDPSAHEWDEFLRNRAGDVREGGTVVVVSPHGAPSDDGPEALAAWLETVRRQRQTWGAMTPDHCAVSFIGAAAEFASDLAGADRPRGPADGLVALIVFMASLGRGLTAVVTDNGATQFV